MLFGMIKVASPTDWRTFQSPSILPVNISSRGWDAGEFSKVASEISDKFAAAVRAIEDDLDKRNFKYAHVISCGATEITGPNRNGDGWSADSLMRGMGSYIKHAKFYRNHNNKKGDPHFGHVKIAMYCPERGYGRLLVALNATKEACGDDPFAKIASAEIDLLDSGKEIKVSHGSHIPYDVCSICSKEAKNRNYYCDSKARGGECDLFGCRYGLTKIADDGRQQFVHNPHNRFYDISSIGAVPGAANQADRVAYAEAFNGFKEAAYDGAVLGSAAIAEKLAMALPDSVQLDIAATPASKRMLTAAMAVAKNAADYQLSYSEGDVPAGMTPGARNAWLHACLDAGQMPGAGVLCKEAGLDLGLAPNVDKTAKASLESLYASGDLLSFVQQHPYFQSPSPQMKVANATRLPSAFDLDPVQTQRNRMQSMIVWPQTISVSQADSVAKLAMDLAAHYVLVAAKNLLDKFRNFYVCGFLTTFLLVSNISRATKPPF